jgi:hypothetical protein
MCQEVLLPQSTVQRSAMLPCWEDGNSPATYSPATRRKKRQRLTTSHDNKQLQHPLLLSGPLPAACNSRGGGRAPASDEALVSVQQLLNVGLIRVGRPNAALNSRVCQTCSVPGCKARKLCAVPHTHICMSGKRKGRGRSNVMSSE